MKITFPSNAIRKVSALALALLTASASLTVFAEGELPLAQIYVSTEGDDSAAGTESAPLATLEAARDAVRALSREQYSGAQVIIRGGEYRRDTTVKLTAATDFRSAMLHTRTKLPYLPERRHSTP